MLAKLGCRCAARIDDFWPRHYEAQRVEAIQGCAAILDGFASLAMTGRVRRSPDHTYLAVMPATGANKGDDMEIGRESARRQTSHHLSTLIHTPDMTSARLLPI